MLPTPLHPAVVHFPIALMFLVPVFAVFALWSIRRSSDYRRAWAIPLILTGALAASAFVALRTGEADEDRVERVVSKNAIHEHEEAAERFLVLSGILFLIATTGLVRGNLGRAARVLTLVGSLGVAAAGAQVGAAGGELVYKHNAASVYTDGAPQQPTDADADH